MDGPSGSRPWVRLWGCPDWLAACTSFPLRWVDVKVPVGPNIPGGPCSPHRPGASGPRLQGDLGAEAREEADPPQDSEVGVLWARGGLVSRPAGGCFLLLSGGK